MKKPLPLRLGDTEILYMPFSVFLCLRGEKNLRKPRDWALPQKQPRQMTGLSKEV